MEKATFVELYLQNLDLYVHWVYYSEDSFVEEEKDCVNPNYENKSLELLLDM